MQSIVSHNKELAYNFRPYISKWRWKKGISPILSISKVIQNSPVWMVIFSYGKVSTVRAMFLSKHFLKIFNHCKVSYMYIHTQTPVEEKCPYCPKGTNKSLPSGYRPISVLPIVSKIHVLEGICGAGKAPSYLGENTKFEYRLYMYLITHGQKNDLERTQTTF